MGASASASRKPAAGATGAAAASAAGGAAAAAELDLTGIDQDLARFQQDELVRQALGRGLELKGYAAQIEQELKEVRACVIGGWDGVGWRAGSIGGLLVELIGLGGLVCMAYDGPPAGGGSQHRSTN
jgi:hypothetical protein